MISSALLPTSGLTTPDHKKKSAERPETGVWPLRMRMSPLIKHDTCSTDKVAVSSLHVTTFKYIVLNKYLWHHVCVCVCVCKASLS
jgi:hypothetical protein